MDVPQIRHAFHSSIPLYIRIHVYLFLSQSYILPPNFLCKRWKKHVNQEESVLEEELKELEQHLCVFLHDYTRNNAAEALLALNHANPMVSVPK